MLIDNPADSKECSVIHFLTAKGVKMAEIPREIREVSL